MKRFLIALALVGFAAFRAVAAEDPGKTMGSPGAPLLLELYSDFSCPGCKHLHDAVLPAIVLDFVKTGKAYLIFREYPLKIHPHSGPAAAYATAAARIGKYRTVSDALFRAPAEWGATGKVWETVAKVLTPEEQKKVQALALDPGVLAEVGHDMDLGNQAKIAATPTIVVTHKLRRQPWSEFGSYDLLRGYLNDLLKK